MQSRVIKENLASTFMWKYFDISYSSNTRKYNNNNNNNNNNFLCANILENQAQWRDKTKGLSNCVNVEQCVSR